MIYVIVISIMFFNKLKYTFSVKVFSKKEANNISFQISHKFLRVVYVFRQNDGNYHSINVLFQLKKSPHSFITFFMLRCIIAYVMHIIQLYEVYVYKFLKRLVRDVREVRSASFKNYDLSKKRMLSSTFGLFVTQLIIPQKT